ncbi:hypothetical protein SAY87_011090 [Trapa incisa]|uniref:BZIP domain-containing protein n=2 Tax=Trapa TaxID=22665 RepID=A0AAN7MF96_TRANT|nr:hypothetical protein SAY87_011090 [Trapa incisa]KAK4795186.1 hypothetical protein SAY86_013180 [Trapa natans]
MASPNAKQSPAGSESTVIIDDKKRKRMHSNRESAKRSRMRKQKHLDDLNSQAARLRGENLQILEQIDAIAQHLCGVAAENSVLRAQMEELSQRLESLNEIVGFICRCTSVPDDPVTDLDVFGLLNSDPFGLAYASHSIVTAEVTLQYS